MLFADGRWINDTMLCEVRVLHRVDSHRLKVRLCEDVQMPNGRTAKVGATRTIPADEYFEFDDDDFYD